MSERLEKEKDFHNIVFEENTRGETKKYYQAAAKSKLFYRELVKSEAEGKNVLEYGCGPGSQAFELAYRAESIIGIDISNVAISKAREEAESKGVDITFKIMNAEELEFSDGTFDLVCGSGILHHLDLNKSFSELSRVLKKEGIGIFYEPLGHNPFINIYRKLTPGMRTEDEAPLLMDNIELGKKYFQNVDINYFHLTTYLAGLVKNYTIFDSLVSILDRFDDKMLSNFEFLKKYAWICVLQVSNPVEKYNR